MRKFIIPLLVLGLITAMLFSSSMMTNAEASSDTEDNIPDDAVITYGYLEAFKEQLKEEILAELAESGGISLDTPYSDISADMGQFIYLSPDSEIIYRGGGAVAITSSDKDGEGITDMSEGTELFSGEPLEYGHIYYSSETDSKKAILITGATAYFTVRGAYEIG